MSRGVLFCIALTIFAFGCGKSDEERAAEQAENAIEKQTGEDADVSFSDDRMSIRSKEGNLEFAGEGQKLEMPEDFPDDVFVMKEPEISVSSSSNELKNIVYKVKEDPAKVTEQYKKEMVEDGWTEESFFESPEGTMLSFKKGEDRSAMVSISKLDDATQVTLIVENGK